jgi:hypothetical protein
VPDVWKKILPEVTAEIIHAWMNIISIRSFLFSQLHGQGRLSPVGTKAGSRRVGKARLRERFRTGTAHSGTGSIEYIPTFWLRETVDFSLCHTAETSFLMVIISDGWEIEAHAQHFHPVTARLIVRIISARNNDVFLCQFVFCNSFFEERYTNLLVCDHSFVDLDCLKTG